MKHGYPANDPLVQLPNVPFILAAAGLFIAAITTGSTHDYGRAVFYAALAAWAWLEFRSGVNRPHRVLGAAALVVAVVKVGEGFGA